MCQRHSQRRATRALAAILACTLMAGCQSQKVSAPSAPPQATGAIEQCAGNLHDLSGYLLQYYVVNNRLPETLDALKPLVDIDRTLPLTCPTSQRPYVYAPQGLRSPTEPRWLLMYEPVAHDGIRNAILGAEPTGNQPLGLWVIQLNERSFNSFRQPAPAP